MKKVTDFINNSLKMLRRRNDIDEKLFKRLLTNLDHVQLSHLYFLPDISKVIITKQLRLTYISS